MSEGATPPADSQTPPIELNEAEKAAVQKAQDGLSEVNPNNPPSDAPQRPEYIPEKFWDAEKGEVNIENLAKSYGELEKSRSAPKEPTPAEAEGGAPEPSKDGKITKPNAEEAPAEGGLNDLFAKVATEYSGDGVSDETYTELEAAGIPKEIAQNYIAGLEAQAEKTLSDIYSYVDGQENYAAMSKWAAEKLTNKELDSFNTALESPELRETAVRGLFSRYQSAAPSEGNLTAPKGGQAGNGDVYTSKDQVLADMRDERYKTDASFRAEVQEKLARSQRSGFKMREQGLFERRIVNA